MVARIPYNQGPLFPRTDSFASFSPRTHSLSYILVQISTLLTSPHSAMPSSDYSFLRWEDAGDWEMSDGPEEEAEGL